MPTDRVKGHLCRPARERGESRRVTGEAGADPGSPPGQQPAALLHKAPAAAPCEPLARRLSQRTIKHRRCAQHSGSARPDPTRPAPCARAPQRGPYLKLSETGAKRPRSTVLLPGTAVKWVYSLLDFYIRELTAG